MKRFLFFISFVFLSCASKQDVSLMNQKEIPLSSDNATSSEPYGYKDNKGVWRRFDRGKNIKVMYENKFYSLKDFQGKYKMDTFKKITFIKEKKEIIALTNDETCEGIINISE